MIHSSTECSACGVDLSAALEHQRTCPYYEPLYLSIFDNHAPDRRPIDLKCRDFTEDEHEQAAGLLADWLNANQELFFIIAFDEGFKFRVLFHACLLRARQNNYAYRQIYNL
jgi:hypothetical protein